METSEQLLLQDEEILTKIFMLRKQKVILDKDLAVLYGVKPIRLREQVKRNIRRFPENFMFQLTEQEVDYMVSHFAIPSRKYLGGALPFAFTEHGILMLANILRSEQAIEVSIRIIEIFIKMRETLMAHGDILIKLENLELKIGKHDEEIQALFKVLKEMLSKPAPTPARRIGFRRSNEAD